MHQILFTILQCQLIFYFASLNVFLFSYQFFIKITIGVCKLGQSNKNELMSKYMIVNAGWQNLRNGVDMAKQVDQQRYKSYKQKLQINLNRTGIYINIGLFGAMRQQPYFCANCKQYHATCKLNVNRSSSVQFLRFSDLFAQSPHAHPQNYNLNSKHHPQQSRLVYDNADSRKIRSSRHHAIAKISSSQSFVSKEDKIQKSYSKEIRNQAHLQSKQKPKFQITTAKKINKNSSSSLSKLKTHDRTIKNVDQFKQQTKNSRKQVTVHMDVSNIKNQQSRNNKGPYYVVTKLNPNQKQNIMDKSNTKLSDIKKSYIYGEKDRPILTPMSKVSRTEDYRYGDLTQSKQQIMQDIQQSNMKAKINLKQIEYRKQQDSQMSVRQLDYANRMSQLKQILKSNERNYKQSTSRTIKEPDQFSRHSKKQQSKGEKMEKHFHNVQHNVLVPKLKQHYKLKILNKLHAHRPNGNKTCCENQSETCKYFDNRCLGISLCDEGEISYIRGMTDLL